LSFTEVAKGTISLFFPANCFICDSVLEPLNRSFICYRCWADVEWLPSFHCIKCGKPLSFSVSKKTLSPLICLKCQKNPPHFQRIFTPTVYKGVMAEAIKLFKYHHKRGIVRGFASIIKSYLEQTNLDSLKLKGIVPVPLHPKRLRERGFNQAEAIAKVLGKYLNVQVWTDFLSRTRYTRPQTELKREEREKNIKDSFVLRKTKNRRGKILLVDDVYTTGATLNEASRKIKETGSEVFAFTLARTPEF